MQYGKNSDGQRSIPDGVAHSQHHQAAAQSQACGSALLRSKQLPNTRLSPTTRQSTGARAQPNSVTDRCWGGGSFRPHSGRGVGEGGGEGNRVRRLLTPHSTRPPLDFLPCWSISSSGNVRATPTGPLRAHLHHRHRLRRPIRWHPRCLHPLSTRRRRSRSRSRSRSNCSSTPLRHPRRRRPLRLPWRAPTGSCRRRPRRAPRPAPRQGGPQADRPAHPLRGPSRYRWT